MLCESSGSILGERDTSQGKRHEMRLSDVTPSEVNALFREAAAMKGQPTVEGMAQNFTELLYKRFEESIVLSRVFATIPLGQLPSHDRDFVNRLSASVGVSQQLKDDTTILSLLGTSGAAPEWNDRHTSAGHMGIPLVSGKFVESIPMVSRLLKEIGVDLGWIEKWKTHIVSKGFLSKSTGMFYVEDARIAEDQDKRKIIASQEFVSSHGVRTVFGFGSGFHSTATLLILITFTRETCAYSTVRPLIKVMEGFKKAVMEHVRNTRFFLE